MQRALILGHETARLFQEALACPDDRNNTHKDSDVVSPFFKSFRDSFVNSDVNLLDLESMMGFVQKFCDKAKRISDSLLCC
jgi:hypothetical protein